MTANLLSVESLSFSYVPNSSKSAVLCDVGLELQGGEALGLLGPNGSGKSTLLQLIAGLKSYRQDQFRGNLWFRGEDALNCSPQKRARWIAYSNGTILTEFPLSVQEAVEMGRYPYSGSAYSSRDARQAIDEALMLCELEALRTHRLHTLSSGQLQRVAMARLLVQDPEILLLDEAFSQMDLYYLFEMEKLLDRLKGVGKSIILVSHDLHFASRVGDRFAVLDQGRVVFDGDGVRLWEEEVVASVYGVSQENLPWQQKLHQS